MIGKHCIVRFCAEPTRFHAGFPKDPPLGSSSIMDVRQDMRRDTGRTLVSRASPDSEEAVCHAAAICGAFVYDAPQSRVVFGFGTVAQLGDEAERPGIRRALVLTTRQRHGEGDMLIPGRWIVRLRTI
jgi:hypothetical protein